MKTFKRSEDKRENDRVNASPPLHLGNLGNVETFFCFPIYKQCMYKIQFDVSAYPRLIRPVKLLICVSKLFFHIFL